MSVLVTYATKYGSTQGIAERIATTLKAQGLKVELQPIMISRDVAGYEALVIGSAAYMGSWLKDAAEFVRRNRSILATKPVWLFSSGPLGAATKDPQVETSSSPQNPRNSRSLGRPSSLVAFASLSVRWTAAS
jgi:menaquinone-dependent protoporphyrinogen oxidase